MVFVGNLVDCRQDWSLRVEESVLVVGGGKVVAREDINNIDNLIAEHGINKEDVVYLDKTQFLLPGFIDTHIHASQFPNLGAGSFNNLCVDLYIICQK